MDVWRGWDGRLPARGSLSRRSRRQGLAREAPALASALRAAWTAALRREAGRVQAIRLRHSERRHEFHSEIYYGPSTSGQRCRCCTHS